MSDAAETTAQTTPVPDAPTGVAIQAYPPHERDQAEAYAAEIGGYVSENYNTYGWVAVRHDAPEGLTVSRWSSIDLPAGTTLQRRASLNVGDLVVSSHSGRRRVTRVHTAGINGGTTTMWLEGITHGPECYPGPSMIPVVERAGTTLSTTADSPSTTDVTAGA